MKFEKCMSLIFVPQYTTTPNRYQHEKAIAQGGYGLLLTRWDKRAASGEELLKQSQDLYSSAPAARLAADSASVGDGSNSGSSEGVVLIPLTGMLQLPQ